MFIVVGVCIVKVMRDWMMSVYVEIYFIYGFEKNKGYGIKEYFEVFVVYGLIELYCKIFVFV